MTKINFKFTGLVTPDMIRKSVTPTEPIPYKIDGPLHAAILKSIKGKRGGIAQFMEEAVIGNVEDLDAVLMAAMDGRDRQRTFLARSSTVQINIEVAETLKQAAEFLKAKNYPRMGRGSVMVACSILEAEKRKLICMVDEQAAIVSTLYNDDPDEPPTMITNVQPLDKVRGKPGPKPKGFVKPAPKTAPKPAPKTKAKVQEKGKPGPKPKVKLLAASPKQQAKPILKKKAKS